MEPALLKKDKIISYFLEKSILLSSDILESLETENDAEDLYNLLTKIDNIKDISVVYNDFKKILKACSKTDVNWIELDRTKVLFEKGKDKEKYTKFIDYLLSTSIEKTQQPKTTASDSISRVKVVFSYNEESKKREAQDFVQHFNNRFRAIEKLLKNRQELQNVTSISRVLGKKDREHISVIGMIKEKQTTKNNNIILDIEDVTGSIKVLINKNKPELYTIANDLVLDDTTGITGVNGQNIIFANNILLPDIPNTNEIKKSEDEVYAIFLSDLHVGSVNFLQDDFSRFLKWINGKIGNEKQKDIASKVGYVFILGDLVDGCGVYPGQEKELIIKDIKEQYRECAKLLSEIPNNIPLIICPGNHDAMRIAEPQLPSYSDFAEPLYKIKNTIMVSNPSLVNIHSSNNFSGFDILLYHGYSFDYYVAEVESLRNKGGYDRADLIMKFLLQRRHLAPTHTSTLYIPDTKEDPLVISKVPDFFVTGHIHKSITSHYRNVTLISGSCWQSKTKFQERVGHKPEPSRVPIVNLKTGEVKILKFNK